MAKTENKPKNEPKAQEPKKKAGIFARLTGKAKIEEENKKNPLTDESLSKILKENVYPIAIRTVAKYREQLDIPVARLRKEL